MPVAGIRAASRRRLKLRAAFSGPSKSGKTYKSLKIAHKIIDILADAGQLAGNGRICVIDTERARSDQYSDVPGFDRYDVYELTHFAPTNYIDALKTVADADYTFTIVDQITHEWSGAGGMLEMSARLQNESQGKKNSFTAWKDATPLHDRFVEALISHPTHLIATMRAKMDYEIIDKKPVKLGLAPVQRNDTEYEFDIFGQIDANHYIEVQARGTLNEQVKGRTFSIDETDDLATLIGRWLTQGISLFDPTRATAVPVEEIQELLTLARSIGMTDANLSKALSHFSANTFNELSEANFRKMRKGLDKQVAAAKAGASV